MAHLTPRGVEQSGLAQLCSSEGLPVGTMCWNMLCLDMQTLEGLWQNLATKTEQGVFVGAAQNRPTLSAWSNLRLGNVS